MRLRTGGIFVLQLLLLACVGLLSTWIYLPLLSNVALWACGLIACGATATASAKKAGFWQFALAGAWTFTLLAPISLVFSKTPNPTLDYYFVMLAWLMAAIVLGTGLAANEKEAGRKWQGISVA